ncbi:hypothetical protein TRAPUB_11082 [Trametes pubescens]|uniref:Uncharacterized protein n=1 Tax=Trametes pubescens TaxID=154538 RepID=A0A1M2VXW5_TRAPU|nr:hypothetical protein TRAPUB_11082 [Trametes pubescens]
MHWHGQSGPSIPSSNFATPPGGVGALDGSGAGTPGCGPVQSANVGLGAKPRPSAPVNATRLKFWSVQTR